MTRAPAQRYARLIGWTLVLAGIVGFFYNADFGSGDGTDRDAALGVLDVNAWHNLVHLSTGLLGLAVAGHHGGSRSYALGLGAVYVLVAIAGFAVGDGEELLDLIPVNTADNLLHTFIGVAGLLAGAATPAVPRPTLRFSG